MSDDPSPIGRRWHTAQEARWRRAATTSPLRTASASPDLVDILLDQARELLKRRDLPGASRAAVVLTHTASEVAAEQTATRLVDRGGAMPDIVRFVRERRRPRSPVPKWIRAMLARWPSFTTYKAHTARRNAVVHEGRDATPAEAAASVKVCEEAIAELRKR